MLLDHVTILKVSYMFVFFVTVDSSTFIGFCRVGVSQSHLFYVVSALQLCYMSAPDVSSFIWLIRTPQ